jgi:putative oxidoreductase
MEGLVHIKKGAFLKHNRAVTKLLVFYLACRLLVQTIKPLDPMKSSVSTVTVRKRKAFHISKATAIEIISALFILLFVYTALSKFLEFANFKNVLGNSPLLSSYNIQVAWTLPIVELTVSLLLFAPRTRLLGLYSSLLLMTLFTVYIGYMLAFTPNLPCSCGGVLKDMTWSQHLIFNLFFTLLATTAIWMTKKRRRQPHPIN